MQAETSVARVLLDPEAGRSANLPASIHGLVWAFRTLPATEQTGHLHFVMTESILVSGRHHALCAVDATRRALEAGHRIGSAAALFETIIENVADTMDRVAERIAQSLDEIEEQVLSVASDLRQKLGLRRTCVRLHRQLSGLRIVFLRLEQSNLKELKPALQLCARKLAQRLDGLDHTVVEMRERSRVLQEELHLKIEEQGNNSLRVLSVLTALLLPPTLVTGIFGMNAKGCHSPTMRTDSFGRRCCLLCPRSQPSSS